MIYYIISILFTILFIVRYLVCIIWIFYIQAFPIIIIYLFHATFLFCSII